MLAEGQEKFLKKRKLRSKIFPWVCGSLFIISGGFWAFLLIRVPHIVNPFYVISQIEAKTLSQSDMALLATLCPIVFSMCLLAAMLFIVIAFAWYRQEIKYLYIIKALQQEKGTDQVNEPQAAIKGDDSNEETE